MSEQRFDAVVIGAGPGGYPAAIRLGQLKVKTAVIEREYMGGVCLNVGCIPSKAVIHAAKMFDKMSHADDIGIGIAGKPTLDMKKMQTWKGGVVNKLTSGVRTLLKGNGVTILEGTAKLEKPGPDGHRIVVQTKDGPQTVVAKNIVIATGSRPIEIPGFKIDQQRIIDSTGALALDEVPKRMVVIGGGYIGLELGMVYAKFGTKVTVVEALPRLLGTMDKDCVAVVDRKLKKMGVEVMVNAKAKSWEDKGDRAVLTVEIDGKTATIDTDKILLSVGRRPNTENLGLDTVGVALDKRGYVLADEHLRTNVGGIYAIGDVIGGMMLAHKATKEGEVVAEVIAGHKAAFDVRTIPAVVFTDPEIASTGLTEEEAKEKGHAKLRVGKFPFAALGRALSVNETDGFVKVIADAGTGELLGVHIVGNGASDLISEAALAIEMGAVADDLRLTIHPHPTLSEAVMEAAAVALGEAIHVINR
ncbi:MAG: dihydrolipoyl dehydrogenase [Deltaproteobacteria bacterium]|nr:dihydrolipoyl dehydrogenase [Deltaproteobacteria bacterium]MCW5808488.1 dihydrolipoyl dehydrogenase [Deltaproteobacteria bacterium]